MASVPSRPRRNAGVLSRRGADTLVLLDTKGGEYFTLDEVGTRIWELCDGSRTVAEVAAAIAEEYDAPAQTIQTDMLELLNELADAGLIHEAT